MQENFTVTTVQKADGLQQTYRASVTLDLDHETFTEHSTVTFDDGVQLESSARYEKGVFYLDGQPLPSSVSTWLNHSAHLILALLALTKGVPLKGTSPVHLSGRVKELNRICENQLNLDQLGQDSSYTLTRGGQQDDDEALTLTVQDNQGVTRMTQILKPA